MHIKKLSYGKRNTYFFVDWQILVPPHAAHHTMLFQIFVPTHLVQIGTAGVLMSAPNHSLSYK